MARECPLCGEKYPGTLTNHVLYGHEGFVATYPGFLEPSYLRCFCGYKCSYHDTLANHWRKEGGLANHLLQETLG